jgi:hypothetical protein
MLENQYYHIKINAVSSGGTITVLPWFNITLSEVVSIYKKYNIAVSANSKEKTVFLAKSIRNSTLKLITIIQTDIKIVNADNNFWDRHNVTAQIESYGSHSNRHQEYGSELCSTVWLIIKRFWGWIIGGVGLTAILWIFDNYEKIMKIFHH